MLRKMAWVGCLGIAPAVLAQEEGTKTRTPQTVYPSSDQTEVEMRTALDELRREREQMKADRLKAKSSKETILDTKPDPEEEQLRSRIAELLGRIKKADKVLASDTSSATPKNVGDKAALHRLSEGQAQFRDGEIDTALETLSQVPLSKLSRRDRLWTQYLLASCHRHRGAVEEATALYQQVAESRDDSFLTESALWHLEFIGWRSELQTQD